ncbi:MAG TPA: hypothetical protein PLH01_00440 [Kiritimatiellia bacterium]|nr:hypothetical protein [Kiritimatiellia bacterium]
MKRIIQCSKCEAKLAIFDFGKPINQKCPKCGNAFVVDSEAGKAKAPESSAPAPTPAAANKAPAPAAADKAPTPAPAATSSEPPAAAKPTAPTEAQAPAKTATPDATPDAAPVKPEPAAEPAAKPVDAPAASPDAGQKEITLKKPAPRAAAKPAPAPAPEPDMPELPNSGVSFLHVVVIIGLLVLSIILQVMNKKAAQRSAFDLAERLNRIEAKLRAPQQP